MINIKVIEIKRIYKRVCTIVTLLMIVLSFFIFAMKTTEVFDAMANGTMDSAEEAIKKEDTIQGQNGLFIAILNKGIPLLEVVGRKENGENQYNHLTRMALSKLLQFDYKDPKTLFGVQIPVFHGVNDKIAINDVKNLDYSQQKTTEVSNAIRIDQSATEDQEGEPNLQMDEGIENSGINGEDTTEQLTETASETEVETIQIISSPVVSSNIRVPNPVKLDLKKPTIFIYHTHATEAYKPHEEENYRSLNNRQYTVRHVGGKLTNQLENKGYKIIHDDTVHDYPSYAQSYTRALETLKSNLSKQSSLKIVFDIHRDAVVSEEQAKGSVVTINGERVATFRMVVGGRNENVEQLRVFAEYIRAKADELYPGIALKTIEKDYAKFNQYNSDYYALIEVGTTANHIDEATRTTKYLAEIIDAVIKDIRKE